MEIEVTGDEFREILEKFIEENVSISELLSMADIYEILSEKYNNEVSDIWEQGDFYLNNKLYSFTIDELNGEHGYSHNCLVEAKNLEEAKKKASEYCKCWYQDGEVLTPYGDSGEVFISITAVWL